MSRKVYTIFRGTVFLETEKPIPTTSSFGHIISLHLYEFCTVYIENTEVSQVLEHILKLDESKQTMTRLFCGHHP